jgi:hypothetical protein
LAKVLWRNSVLPGYRLWQHSTLSILLYSTDPSSSFHSAHITLRFNTLRSHTDVNISAKCRVFTNRGLDIVLTAEGQDTILSEDEYQSVRCDFTTIQLK